MSPLHIPRYIPFSLPRARLMLMFDKCLQNEKVEEAMPPLQCCIVTFPSLLVNRYFSCLPPSSLHSSFPFFLPPLLLFFLPSFLGPKWGPIIAFDCHAF